MNRDNIIRTRDAIQAAGDEHFRMDIWATDSFGYFPRPTNVLNHDCGTAACIGGWAETLSQPDADLVGGRGDTLAEGFLGLNQLTAVLLFMPDVPDLCALTSADGVEVLNLLLETGQVRWLEVARRNHPEMFWDEDKEEE